MIRTVAMTWLCLGTLGACSQQGAPQGLPWSNADLVVLSSMTPLRPAKNTDSSDRALAEFGWRLFFDPGLSRTGTLSCASCHQPALHFTDGLPRAEGLGLSKHNTPTVVGLGDAPFLTWNGSKDSLWSQSFGPLFGPVEMGNTPEGVAEHIRQAHETEHEAVFGPSEHKTPLEISIDVGLALQAYQERLVPPPAPFDLFLEKLFEGDPQGGGHMTREAVRGLRSFIGDGGCVGCHSGPWLSDFSFHALPLPGKDTAPNAGRARGIQELRQDPFRRGGPWGPTTHDPGYEHLDPHFAHHQGSYKTPSLRNVERTAPYGHTGEFATLEDVLRFYEELSRHAQGRHLDPLLEQSSGDLPMAELGAFLRSLTSPPSSEHWFRPPTTDETHPCRDLATPNLPAPAQRSDS